jgi:glycerophosphoryl diester phosphodiesterase
MPLALAHRGDWSASPENTLAAFEAAERAGADMVELDVRRTADGEVAVIHDPTCERVWGSQLRAAGATIAELRELRVADHGIPTLTEVLEAVALPVMVDYTLADVVEPALEAVESAGALDRVVFSGGNVEGHLRIRSLAPRARIALTWTKPEPPAGALLEQLEPEFFNPCWDLGIEPFVVAMHGLGLKVSTWTIDDEVDMSRAIDLGVDAVISNRVGMLVALLAEARC